MDVFNNHIDILKYTYLNTLHSDYCILLYAEVEEIVNPDIINTAFNSILTSDL